MHEAARWLLVAIGAAVLAGSAAGCLQILGDEGPFVLATGGGGTGGTAGPGGGPTGGGGAASACEPAKTEACYDGPEGTLDVGLCKGGTHTCGQDATWGVCSGQVLPGIETCASKDDEDCDEKECARWSLMSGGDGEMIGSALATAPGGDVLFAGLFGGQVKLGDETLDASTNGPLFVAKLDAAGNPQWARTFGGIDIQKAVPRSMACDAAGNIFMLGVIDGKLEAPGTLQTSNGQDLFVAKFTTNGTLAWLRLYGGSADQEPWNMVVASDGNILITGTYDSGFSMGGTSTIGAGAFVAKLSSSNGDDTSAKTFDTLVGPYVSPRVAAGPDDTWFLSGDCSDGAVIGGNAPGTCSHFVAKFDADDTLLWLQNVPGLPSGLVASSDGSVVLAGDFEDTIDFGRGPITSKGGADVFVARLAAMGGALEWATAFGGAGQDVFPRLVIDSQDRLYLAIDAEDTIDFGGGPLGSAGLTDTFVLALNAEGEHRWSRVFGDATIELGSLLAVRGGDAGLIASLNTPGKIDFGAGPLQAMSAQAVAIAELGP